MLPGTLCLMKPHSSHSQGKKSPPVSQRERHAQESIPGCGQIVVPVPLRGQGDAQTPHHLPALWRGHSVSPQRKDAGQEGDVDVVPRTKPHRFVWRAPPSQWEMSLPPHPASMPEVTGTALCPGCAGCHRPVLF